MVILLLKLLMLITKYMSCLCNHKVLSKNEDIKSILTKEQFEYMEYRIGE